MAYLEPKAPGFSYGLGTISGAGEAGQLRWIPWDNNESLSAGRAMGGGGMGADMGAAMGPGGAPGAPGQPGDVPGDTVDAVADIFHTTTNASWPLIQLLLADEVYASQYRGEVEGAVEGLFEIEQASARLNELHDMIAPYVVGDDGERASHTTIQSTEAFEASVTGPDGLLEHITARHAVVTEALEAR